MICPYSPGYYRDSDSVHYVARDGGIFYVFGPDTLEPVFWDVGPPLPDDAEPANLDAEDFAWYERCRLAYGIPE
jgi:hypothetical protein